MPAPIRACCQASPAPAPTFVGPVVVWSVGASDFVDASVDGCALASDSWSLGDSDWGRVQSGAVR